MVPLGAVRGVDEFRATLESLVGGRPELVAGAVLATLLLLLAVGWLLRRLRTTPGERFRSLLAERDAVTVLMHPDPDPDAMGSAVGIAHIAGSVDTDIRLCYTGEIRRHENRAFRTVLDLDFERIEDASDLGASETRDVVLVDHNEPRGFVGAAEVEPVAVVDHHPGGGEGGEFTDVRTEYGACASIVAEYLETLNARPESAANGGLTLDSGVATALLYGIQADTAYLSRGCTSAEFDRCAYLHPAIDADTLDRIANPPVDAETLDVKARAIDGRLVRMPFVVSDVGTVSNVDTIPQAADELLRLEGATAVVVFGEKDDTYHISGRSQDDRVHMGHALELAVSEMIDDPDPPAGGHARMGGGQLPIDAVGSEVDRARLTDRLFTAMNGEEA